MEVPKNEADEGTFVFTNIFNELTGLNMENFTHCVFLSKRDRDKNRGSGLVQQTRTNRHRYVGSVAEVSARFLTNSNN